MYSLFQNNQKKLSFSYDRIIYFAYIILTIYAVYSYIKTYGINREKRTDYEYDGIIPQKYRKIVVYSCLIGDYDKVSTFNKQRGYDYILFTDQNIKRTNWSVYPIPEEVLKLNVSDIKKQRYMKIHPHKFFKNYDLSIYIDANYVIKGDLDEFLTNTLNPIDHIYIPHLQFGKQIKQAIQKAIDNKLDDKNILETVRQRYEKEKVLDKTGIVNAGLIIRKHHTEDCIKLMDKWWEEVENYSHVDNFEFDYAAHVTGVRFIYISFQFTLYYFGQNEHLKKIDY